MILTLAGIAELVDGELRGGPGDVTVRSIRPLDAAGPDDLSFLTNPKYRNMLYSTQAAAVLIARDPGDAPCPLIVCPNPYWALAKIMQQFFKPPVPDPGIHVSAVIPDSCELGNDVRIGALVVLGRNVRIGARTVVFPGTVIGDGTRIGEDTMIYPNVSIYHQVSIGNRVILHSGCVIGSDGFGFAKQGARYEKIPQIGTVVIEDDVEIGAATTIDRGSLGTTMIKRGTKLDNLIQIAHNVIIGEDTVIAAQTGIAGSTSIGDRATVGGQVGIGGHLTIGNDVIFTAKCGVSKSTGDHAFLSGYPSAPHREWLRLQGALSKGVEMKRTIKELEERISRLEKEIKG